MLESFTDSSDNPGSHVVEEAIVKRLQIKKMGMAGEYKHELLDNLKMVK